MWCLEFAFHVMCHVVMSHVTKMRTQTGLLSFFKLGTRFALSQVSENLDISFGGQPWRQDGEEEEEDEEGRVPRKSADQFCATRSTVADWPSDERWWPCWRIIKSCRETGVL